MNLFSGFYLFMAGLVYCHDLRLSRQPNILSQPSLEFLQQVLEELGEFQSVAQHFKTQLQIEIDALRNIRRHPALRDGRKQSDLLRPKETNSQQPPGSTERGTSRAACHLLNALASLLQHDTHDIWFVQEVDIDRFPHIKEQNRGLHMVKVVSTKRKLNSANDYEPRGATRNFTTTLELASPTTGVDWQWSLPVSSSPEHQLNGRYDAQVHELFDLILGENR